MFPTSYPVSQWQDLKGVGGCVKSKENLSFGAEHYSAH